MDEDVERSKNIKKKLGNKINKLKSKKTDKTVNIIFDIIAIICIIIMAVAVVPRTMQNDTYYNIKCGEYIFENGLFGISDDPFSWHDLEYTWPHWLYDLFMYFIYAICGRFWEVGIYVTTIILTSILGISMYGLCVKLTKKNRVVSLIATLCGLYILEPYIAARAQLVTFILFVWEILCIEKLLETNKKRYGFGILAIAFLVVQLHCAVFPMIFVFAAPYIVEYLFAVLIDLDLDERFFGFIVGKLIKYSKSESEKERYYLLLDKSKKNIESRKIKREKQRKNPYKVIVSKNKATITLIIFLCIAIFIGFLNPMGTGAFTYTYKIYQGNTTDSINEHLPLTLANNPEYAVMLIVLFVILIMMDIKVRLSDLFMIAGTIFLSFTARRQVSLVVIMVMPILAKLVAGFFEKYDYKTCNILKKGITSVVGVVLTIALVTFIVKDMYIEKLDDEYVSTSSYPVAATDWLISYMEENNISSEDLHLYNEYNYGSYLLFRDIPVFIDSRCDLYTPEFGSEEDIFTDALNIPGLNSDYEELFDKYDVRYIMLYKDSGLNTNLLNDDDYELLYDDSNFVIYKRLSTE